MRRPLPAGRAMFALALLLTVSVMASAQECGCNFVVNPPASPTTSVFVDGEKLGVKPGQTICLTAGFFRQIRLIRIAGEPGNPVTIKNCGGVVQIGDSINYGRWYAVDIVGSRNIRFTGTGDPAYRYGIVLAKSGDSGLKVGASTDTEIDHLEIGDTGFAGIMAKSDYAGNPPPDAPEMNNVNIHDNYIHDTRGEGMYIGETKTPGQNFRHLEVWNNIVTRTGYDLFQVANVVEDVAVHHNVFYQAGTRNVLYQNKGLQIGDNSVGRYYNNFIIGAPSNLMIVMGSGNIEVSNNYMAGAGDPGIYVDNRSVSLPGTPIAFDGNFLMDVPATFPFLKVLNEVNQVSITGNKFDGTNAVLSLGSGAGPNLTESGNVIQVLERVQFIDVVNDNFTLEEGSPYAGLGLLTEGIARNERPFISLIADQEIDFETIREIPVVAKDPDGDAIILEASNLPSFITFRDNGNGNGVFTLAPQTSDVGVFHKVRVRVTDSHGAMNTEYYSVRVLDPYAFIVTASSSLENFFPENTLDNDLSTRWAPVQDSLHWIRYDLREDKLVTDVRISFYEGASAIYPFDIEISQDDLTWTKVFSGENSPDSAEAETFSFEAVRARYLRIVDRKDPFNSYNEVVIRSATAPVAHQMFTTADVYLDNKKIYNNSVLNVRGSQRKSFMRFEVSGLDVNKAAVVNARLIVTAKANGMGSLKVFLGEHSNWTENFVSKSDLPDAIQVLDTLTTHFIAGMSYELDVMGAIRDNGTYTFILEGDNSGVGLSFSSAEGGFPPQVSVETLRGATPIAPTVAGGSAQMSSSELVTPELGRSTKEVNLYPNPATNQVTVDLGTETARAVSVEICDQVGRSFLVKGWTQGQQYIDLDLDNLEMEPGLYILKVKQDGLPLRVLRMFKE